ncbi:MAG: SBBP repeat-containing protein [Nitrospirae bacterium]|nr:SBBP repeat-containing protein [Nitrospirota bacterium]
MLSQAWNVIKSAFIISALFAATFSIFGGEARAGVDAELPYQTLWTRQMGTSGDDQAYDVSVDGAGNVYMTGYTYGGLDGNTNAGMSDLFVLKYNSDGVQQWTRQLGTAADDRAHGVAVDGTGNVLCMRVYRGWPGREHKRRLQGFVCGKIQS